MITQIRELSSQARYGLTLLGGAGLVIIVLGVVSIFSYKLAGILLLAIVIAVGVGGGIWTLFRRREKRRAAQVEEDLKSDFRSRPDDATDPESVGAVEDARKKFEQGLAMIRQAGKPIGELAWYLIVGEPSSGKTEAIRRGGLQFPDGMDEEYKGLGGTINMDWWFTEHGAVLLDTAGKLLFEKAERRENKEWPALLGRIRRARKDRPISGILLFLPTDSLLTDTPDEAELKAKGIAKRLHQIQEVLGIRCPVYVVISKADLISGFREFFDEMVDPQLMRQILGWSNLGAELDEFDPKSVRSYLDSLSRRLREYRMALLRRTDPMREARRLDEMDALYDFPNRIEDIASRLEVYLERIFSGGYWSSSPLFCRGIYFTSAMIEGAELDTILCSTVGLNPEDLPEEERPWQRQRSLFIRDLFLEKVLPEQGLVSRAKDATRVYRRRRLALFGTGVLASILLIVVTALGIISFQSSVGNPRDLWDAVADLASEDMSAYTFNGEWRGDDEFGKQLPNDESVTLVELPGAIRTLDKQAGAVKVPGLFSPFVSGRDLRLDRLEACLRIYNRVAERELLSKARNEVHQRSFADFTPTQIRAGLAQLIRIEVNAADNRPKALDVSGLLEFGGVEVTNQQQLQQAVEQMFAQHDDAGRLRNFLADLHGQTPEIVESFRGIEELALREFPVDPDVVTFSDFERVAELYRRYEQGESQLSAIDFRSTTTKRAFDVNVERWNEIYAAMSTSRDGIASTWQTITATKDWRTVFDTASRQREREINDAYAGLLGEFDPLVEQVEGEDAQPALVDDAPSHLVDLHGALVAGQGAAMESYRMTLKTVTALMDENSGRFRAFSDGADTPIDEVHAALNAQPTARDDVLTAALSDDTPSWLTNALAAALRHQRYTQALSLLVILESEDADLEAFVASSSSEGAQTLVGLTFTDLSAGDLRRVVEIPDAFRREPAEHLCTLYEDLTSAAETRAILESPMLQPRLAAVSEHVEAYRQAYEAAWRRIWSDAHTASFFEQDDPPLWSDIGQGIRALDYSDEVERIEEVAEAVNQSLSVVDQSVGESADEVDEGLIEESLGRWIQLSHDEQLVAAKKIVKAKSNNDLKSKYRASLSEDPGDDDPVIEQYWSGLFSALIGFLENEYDTDVEANKIAAMARRYPVSINGEDPLGRSEIQQLREDVTDFLDIHTDADKTWPWMPKVKDAATYLDQDLSITMRITGVFSPASSIYDRIKIDDRAEEKSRPDIPPSIITGLDVLRPVSFTFSKSTDDGGPGTVVEAKLLKALVEQRGPEVQIEVDPRPFVFELEINPPVSIPAEGWPRVADITEAEGGR